MIMKEICSCPRVPQNQMHYSFHLLAEKEEKMERRERGKEEEEEAEKEREKVRGAGTLMQFHELWKMERKEGMREKWMKKPPKRPPLVSKQKIAGQVYHG